MTAEREYFVYLLSCFLNGEAPQGRNIDYNELFRIADINDVGAVISHEILQLNEFRPEGTMLSNFKQVIGLTLKEYEQKINAYKAVDSFLEANNIDRIYVKGIAVRSLYPVKEFRTFGDVDVIVRAEQFAEITDLVKTEKSFNVAHLSTETLNFYYNGIEIEIHKTHDVASGYFDSIFSLCKNEGSLYTLNPNDHLLYVLCHLIKHLKYRGAGIRMLMDIDVLIRSIDCFDEEHFFDLARSAGVRKSAEVLLSLSNFWFKTPVSSYVDFESESDLLDMLSSALIDGGSFGYESSTLSDYHISRGIKDGEDVTPAVKAKAVIRLAFPEKEYMKTYYDYANRNSALLPLAYVNRLFDAVFKRSKHSKNTFKGIIDADNSASAKYQLLKELGLNKE